MSRNNTEFERHAKATATKKGSAHNFCADASILRLLRHLRACYEHDANDNSLSQIRAALAKHWQSSQSLHAQLLSYFDNIPSVVSTEWQYLVPLGYLENGEIHQDKSFSMDTVLRLVCAATLYHSQFDSNACVETFALCLQELNQLGALCPTGMRQHLVSMMADHFTGCELLLPPPTTITTSEERDRLARTKKIILIESRDVLTHQRRFAIGYLNRQRQYQEKSIQFDAELTQQLPTAPTDISLTIDNLAIRSAIDNILGDDAYQSLAGLPLILNLDDWISGNTRKFFAEKLAVLPPCEQWRLLRDWIMFVEGVTDENSSLCKFLQSDNQHHVSLLLYLENNLRSYALWSTHHVERIQQIATLDLLLTGMGIPETRLVQTIRAITKQYYTIHVLQKDTQSVLSKTLQVAHDIIMLAETIKTVEELPLFQKYVSAYGRFKQYSHLLRETEGVSDCVNSLENYFSIVIEKRTLVIDAPTLSEKVSQTLTKLAKLLEEKHEPFIENFFAAWDFAIHTVTNKNNLRTLKKILTTHIHLSDEALAELLPMDDTGGRLSIELSAYQINRVLLTALYPAQPLSPLFQTRFKMIVVALSTGALTAELSSSYQQILPLLQFMTKDPKTLDLVDNINTILIGPTLEALVPWLSQKCDEIADSITKSVPTFTISEERFCLAFQQLCFHYLQASEDHADILLNILNALLQKMRSHCTPTEIITYFANTPDPAHPNSLFLLLKIWGQCLDEISEDTQKTAASDTLCQNLLALWNGITKPQNIGPETHQILCAALCTPVNSNAYKNQTGLFFLVTSIDIWMLHCFHKYAHSCLSKPFAPASEKKTEVGLLSSAPSDVAMQTKQAQEAEASDLGFLSSINKIFLSLLENCTEGQQIHTLVTGLSYVNHASKKQCALSFWPDTLALMAKTTERSKSRISQTIVINIITLLQTVQKWQSHPRFSETVDTLLRGLSENALCNLMLSLMCCIKNNKATYRTLLCNTFLAVIQLCTTPQQITQLLNGLSKQHVQLAQNNLQGDTSSFSGLYCLMSSLTETISQIKKAIVKDGYFTLLQNILQLISDLLKKCETSDHITQLLDEKTGIYLLIPVFQEVVEMYMQKIDWSETDNLKKTAMHTINAVILLLLQKCTEHSCVQQCVHALAKQSVLDTLLQAVTDLEKRPEIPQNIQEIILTWDISLFSNAAIAAVPATGPAFFQEASSPVVQASIEALLMFIYRKAGAACEVFTEVPAEAH